MRRLTFSLLSCLLLVSPSWAAPRSEAGRLADAPFLTTLAAVVRDNLVVAAGQNETGDAGLALYAREAEGALTLLATRSHRELGLDQVAALAASPDGLFLYLLGETSSQPRIVVLALGGGGELNLVQQVATLDLGSFADVRHLAISHDGRHLYASSNAKLVVYDRGGSDGRLALRQSLSGGAGRLLLSPDDALLYVAEGTQALRSFTRNSLDGTLTAVGVYDNFAAFGLTISAGIDLAQSPDGRFLYLLGVDESGSLDTFAVLAFENLGGGLLVLQSRGPGSTSPTLARAIAVNPRNGSLYLGTFDEDESLARLASFPPKEGGRDFLGQAAIVTAPAVPGYVEFPQALVPAASGDQLYFGAFDALPLEVFATAGAEGALSRASSAHGGTFGLAEMQDFAVSPSGSKLLVAAPASGRAGWAGWNGDLSFGGAAKVAGHPTIARLAFLDENHAAGLVSQPSGSFDLQLFELAASGALVARGSRFAVGEAHDLWASPDGRQLYVAGPAAIRRFEYATGSASLSSKGLVGDRGGYGPVRFSGDGRTVFVVANEEALVIPLYHTLIYRFDPATGVLTAENEDSDLASGALDYALSPDGNDLYVLKNGPDLDDLRVQLRRRGTGGTFDVGVQQLILTAASTRVDRPAQMVLDPSGRRLAVLDTADGQLFLFDRDPADGTLTQVSNELALTLSRGPFQDWAGEIAFGPGGNELWLLDSGASRLEVSRFGCAAELADELCLGNAGRFRVEVDWFTGGGRGPAQRVVAPASDSGLFYFFDPNNWEMLVKVLDACSLNGKYWVFAAATTDVGYDLRVVDTLTGKAATYHNPLGTASPAITDTGALAICPAAASGEAAGDAGGEAAARASAGTVLRLRDRFELKVTWRSAAGSGAAQVVPFGSADSGLFYFFSENNWEMLVKVLDGCAINQHYWVLAAATTDVGYTLEVKDLLAGGAPKTYTNPIGRAAPAIIDLQALGGCTP